MVQSHRQKAVRSLRQEAMELRKWADAHLPERERIEPYMLASRLELLATELAGEPVWQRLGADVAETTQAVLETAHRRLKRVAS